MIANAPSAALPAGMVVTVSATQGSRFNRHMGQIERQLSDRTYLVRLWKGDVVLPFGRSELR